jgi:hypothetical protein
MGFGSGAFGGGSGKFSFKGAVKYRMRGFDTTLSRIVYWESNLIDTAATDYGGPGPVNDIMVSNKIGEVL